jgi:hypothetical protein
MAEGLSPPAPGWTSGKGVAVRPLAGKISKAAQKQKAKKFDERENKYFFIRFSFLF